MAELLADETTKSSETPKPKNDFYQNKEQQKILRNLKRKITQIEETLTSLDTSIDELEQSMNDPALVDDHVKLMALNDELESQRTQQETLLTDWENLSLELEEFEDMNE